MWRKLGSVLTVATASLLFLPIAADAQSVFSGVVRDASGAVLPGVTVEASSPVLIERTRSVVTDGEGRRFESTSALAKSNISLIMRTRSLPERCRIRESRCA
jgi:hypothetical protein